MSKLKLGIDHLLSDDKSITQLKGKRVALLATPASMTQAFVHSIDAIRRDTPLNLTAAFGPQHGLRGEKQDNMVESTDYIDPIHQIPVYSLYGEVRKPTSKMLDAFDVLLVDLQDIGTRVYTFLTTLFYVMEACAQTNKTLWVLDRPNPAGRPIEGTLLDPKKWTSFVGAAAFPMRHGLTLGEAAQWFVKNKKLNLDLRVIPMQHYDPTAGPGFGWPLGELPWVNPSPNAASLSMARCYPGTVMLEGTHLSEGRGTTHPLELLGAPDLDGVTLLKTMENLAPRWMEGCRLRPCYFQPTFHKYVDKMCSGFQIHVDDTHYKHEQFKPYRLIALTFKAIRHLYPNYSLWRDFHYEYEKDRLAIDLINGGPTLREWVDDPNAAIADFEDLLTHDEQIWLSQRKPFLLYASGQSHEQL